VRVQLDVLGDAQAGNPPTRLRGRRTRQLLELLAWSGPAGMSVPALGQAIWGRPSDTALRKVVQHARRALGDSAALANQRGHYLLDPRRVRCDLWDLEAQAAQIMVSRDLPAVRAWAAAAAAAQAPAPLTGQRLGERAAALLTLVTGSDQETQRLLAEVLARQAIR
jgi:hypothetical protein